MSLRLACDRLAPSPTQERLQMRDILAWVGSLALIGLGLGIPGYVVGRRFGVARGLLLRVALCLGAVNVVGVGLIRGHWDVEGVLLIAAGWLAFGVCAENGARRCRETPAPRRR